MLGLAAAQQKRESVPDWRGRLRRELTWLLLIKSVALLLLWWLFFAGMHQPQVDATGASQRLIVDGIRNEGSQPHHDEERIRD